ncbi:MAG: response regulator transcription factor [Thiothrix sp.]|nr:MAG: response regulator transcription factor [Thiothrix sp.]
MLVLLIEDHRLLAETLIDYLNSEAIEVDYAATGLQGLELATQQAYDALILDINLPDLDGFAICQRLRQQYGLDLPILMLTARDQLADRLHGFAQGADDYLVKPFASQELVARLQALVKRNRGQVVQKRLDLGDLSIDTSTQQVWRAEQEILVSPTGFKILRILMREAPAIVSREALQNEVWGTDIPDTDALRSHLYNLRKALNRPDQPELIHTIKGVGFKLAN